MSGFSTPASILSLAEEKLSGCDSDLDLPIESPKATRVISSYREKKRKKKKKKRSHGSSHAGSSTTSVQLEDIVWGPVNGYPSWPGKVVSKESVHEDDMNTSRSNSIDEDTQPSQATP